MKKLSLEEVFITSALHLIIQGEQSIIDDGGFNEGVCMYHSPKGLACAVGVFLGGDLSKEEGMSIAEPYLENGRWIARHPSDANIVKALNASSLPATEECRELLIRLQRAHDYPDTKEDMLSELKNVELRFFK